MGTGQKCYRDNNSVFPSVPVNYWYMSASRTAFGVLAALVLVISQ